MSPAQRKELHAEIEALRRELRDELAEIRQRLDLLEKPKIARVVIDPSKPEPGGAPQR
jgi:hypothetical protein